MASIINGKNKRVGVIGAGPAGLTAAYELAKAGIAVEVFEASKYVGGLAKTISLWNQRVDTGPHRFFSDDTRVNKLWLEVVGKDYKIIDRLTRIFYKNKFYFYPLKPFNALFNLGIWESFICLISYFKEKIKPTKLDGSFETWVVNRFGRRLFEIFFKTYSEKLWGISCKDLDEDFAAQRIKKLSLLEAIKNAIFQKTDITHKTLADQFAYPIQGTGMVYERMADFINSHGGKVHLEKPVNRVVTKNKKVTGIELVGGEIKDYDHIISSMPITLLVNRLDEVPNEVKTVSESLKFRNTILVYLNIESQNLFPDNWLYVHSSDLKLGRITNFRNWVPELYGEEKSTIVALEYWCNDDEPLWSEKDNVLIDLGKKELAQAGLLKNSKVLDGYVYRISRCYPVYNRGYKGKLNLVESFLDSISGLTVIGRYGAFKYNNQDHSILMGLLAAENIIKSTRHDLWKINTDYETYQEASVITKTGLQKK